MKMVSRNLPGYIKFTASIHMKNVIDYLRGGTLNLKGMEIYGHASQIWYKNQNILW